MKQQEKMMVGAFLAFLISSGCTIPAGEPLDLNFKVADGRWFAILTVGTAFGVATEYYEFSFEEWVRFSGGS